YANGDSLMIQYRADIMRMYAVHDKGNDTGLIPGGAYQAKAGYTLQLRGGVIVQRLQMLFNGGLADGLDILRRRTQGNCLGDCRGSGFEFIWNIGKGGFLETDLPDHFPAALPGGHRFQQRLARPEDTDAGRTV